MEKQDRKKVVRTLLLPVERCNQECIAKLEELLERARSGEIIGVHGIAELSTTYFAFSTKTMSRLQVMGALMEAVMHVRSE